MPRRRGVVLGFDYHARYLARMINRNGERWELRAFPNTRVGMMQALWSLRSANALIAFGGPGPSVALAEAAAARNLPIAVIWAGSDVLISAEMPFDLAVIKRRGYHNTAVAPWLVDELRTIGVDAACLPVAGIDRVDVIAPLPQRFRVITYLPEPRRGFYGGDRVYELARAMPDVEFAVTGPGERDPHAPPNVTFTGYLQDVASQLDQSTVLLRLADHDGMSVLVLEALGRARHVVWTHELPGVQSVGDAGEALEALRRLRERHRRGELPLNHTGRQYVEEHFAVKDVARGIELFLDRIVDKSIHAGSARKRSAAISGLGLFSAEVAEQVERLSPVWSVRMLRTGSRLEVLSSLYNVFRSDVWYSIGSPITDRWVHWWARLLRKRRVVHWVGSDIEHARQTAWVCKQLRSPRIKHLAEVDWTADELRELGMNPEIVPLPLRQRAHGVKPLPERFTILLYVPKARPEFYGGRDYEALLEDFAGEGIRAIVVGGADVRAPEGVEMINLGWRGDLREAYEQSTVLIRLTPRDGLSLMVLEALSFGRYVMWSKPFPYCTQVSGKSDIVRELRAMLERHRAGSLLPQYAAAEMIARTYSSERAVDRILATWEVAS
ncbi:MAG TPA: hypothetical protein VMF61_08895 [Candidatus Acidoferrales bacterium]|nr:hypothetical protein [Candidatus Acidoferrales bacterium]